jgi:hypothetical protein
VVLLALVCIFSLFLHRPTSYNCHECIGSCSYVSLEYGYAFCDQLWVELAFAFLHKESIAS